MNRNNTIQRILDRESAGRRSMATACQRNETKGTDGHWYSLGWPRGVSPTEEKRSYWVLRARDGRTFGKRFDTEAELLADREASIARCRSEFEAQLLTMTDEALAAQADYWFAK